MVRKKVKVAPAAPSANNGDMNDLTGTVCRWIKDLDLVGHELIPTVSPDLNIFSLLHAPGESAAGSTTATAFAQARGLQSLRAAVVGGRGSAEDIRLVFLVSLLLYLDPRTSHLRKAVKILLATAEKILKEQHSGSGTSADDMVDLVAARFVAGSWEIHAGMVGIGERTASAAGKAASDAAALSTAASLQWLIDVPSGKRAILSAQDGTLFARLVAVLDAMLAVQVPVVKEWHAHQFGEVGRRQDSEVAGAELPESDVLGGRGGANGAGEQAETGRKDASTQELPTAIDCCSEILKATACLMALNKKWDVKQLPGSDATLLRMCESCFLLLAVPTVRRECATHASAVLVHLAVASWRDSGRWPSEAWCSPVENAVGTAPAQSGAAAAAAAATSTTATATGVETPAAPISPEPKGTKAFAPKAASIMIYKSFFAVPCLEDEAVGAGNDGADAITALATGFMPLPPGSALALCRALFHIVRPSVLLADFGSSNSATGRTPPVVEGMGSPEEYFGGGGVAGEHKFARSGVVGPTSAGDIGREQNLMFGPILRTILRRGGADSGLSLRYFALQILQAWCHKVEAFSTSGLPLQGESYVSIETGGTTLRDGDEDGGRYGDRAAVLSEVMDLTMSALVHPAKLISSMAPVLLEHVFTLRHLMIESEGGVGGGSRAGNSEPERLVGRVLQQPAASKGKYVALAVLLPRVGAARMLELCHSFVEQLVWAVGVRGNVSGQAVSLLLQFLKALSTERSMEGPVSAARSPSIRTPRPAAAAAAADSGVVPAAAAVEAPTPSSCTGGASAMCRSCWVKPAATALMQEDLWSRTRVAAYLLPEMFKLDPGSVSDLFLELRSREAEEKGSPFFLRAGSMEGDDGVEPDVRRMWAMIEVARYARRCGATGGLSVIAVDDSAGLLPLEEVRWAALHVDETLRMSALSLLCTDVRVTTVPAQHETELLKEVLPYSLKVFGAQNRQALLRAMQTLLVRMRETARVCGKEPAGSTGAPGDHRRRKKYAKHNEGGVERHRGGRDDVGVSDTAKFRGVKETGPSETPSETIERVESLLRWLCEEVLKSLYPGCPFEREVLGLELVQLVLSELLPTDDLDVPKQGDASKQVAVSDQAKGTLAHVVSSSLFCRHWVDTLLALLGSSWDRSRSLAYSTLARFPRPLAGYDGLAGATRLAAQGLRSSGSGRQRESDRGALILRLVFGSYARGLGLRLPLKATEVAAGRSGVGAAKLGGVAGSGGAVGVGDGDMAVEEEEEDATARFLEELCGVLSLRLDGMQRSFDEVLRRQTGEEVPYAASSDDASATETNAPPSLTLPHGVLLAAHHVLLDSKLPAKGAGKAGGGGRARRGAKPRRKEGTTREGVVQWERRRSAVGLLLEEAFRALRLSLLIVGERGVGDDGSDGDDDGSDNDMMAAITTSDPLDVGKASGKPRSSVSVNANGHMGMVSLETRGPSISTKPAAGPTNTGPHGTTTAGAREDDHDENAGANTDKVVRGKEETEAMHRSAIEGQRAVVGAWLLAKEACRFLATVVAASPLPSAGSGKATVGGDGGGGGGGGRGGGGGGAGACTREGAGQGAGDLNRNETGVSAGSGEGGTIAAERSGTLLADADVSAIGETLLKTLLSLKHMGCVASAQAALQGVCEALLHSGKRNTSLMSLPSLWMDQLLRQLTGEKQEFVLRRSAGLALAFMAILRAEPRSVEPVLLPRCMRHLLAMAMATATGMDGSTHPGESNSTDEPATAAAGAPDAPSRSDWKDTVHAMNVLRVVFVDATLADDVGPYVTKATMAAVCGFEHPVWAVRNSSMMLFSSIMQRAVGGAKNAAPGANFSGAKRPHSGRGAVTAAAFFQQHPKLRPFLLSQLERATAHDAGARNDETPRTAPQQRLALARAEMHPVLYPILLLLARLKAGAENVIAEAEQREGTRAGASRHHQASPTSPFIPLVTSCSRNPHFLARVASSRALAALVPPTHVPGLIRTLLGRLPKSADDKMAATNGSNHIHGTLLQVLELLLAVRASKNDGQLSRNGSSASSRLGIQEDSAKDEEGAGVDSLSGSAGPSSEESLSTQTAIVLELLWLADPALSRCPPVRHAMLRVTEVFSELATADAVKSALRMAQELNFSNETNWRIGSSSSSSSPPADRRVVPGRSLLLSAAAGAVVRRRLASCLVGEGAEGGHSAAGSAGPRFDSSSSVAAYTRSKPGNDSRDVSPSVPGGVVGGVEARIGTGIGESGEDARQLDLLMGLMSSTDVDVRDAVIKATKKFFGHGALQKADTESCKASLLVWAGASKSLSTETYPPNVRRLVRLLARVGLHLRDCSLPPPVDQLWDHLRRLCDDERGSEDVHAGALEVMGVIVRLGEAQERQRTSDEDGFWAVSRQVDDYASLLELVVGSAQPVVTRKAAVASLSSSGLLKTLATSAAATPVPSSGCSKSPSSIGRRETSMPSSASVRQGDGLADSGSSACVRLWFVALSLLQDDEQSVRACAARACAAAATSVSSSAKGAAGSTGGRVDLCAVDFALAHMATIAEDMGTDTLASFVKRLVRMLSNILAASGTRDLLSAEEGVAGALPGGAIGSVVDVQHMDQDRDDNDHDMIFGHEEWNGLHEPTLFASVAATYLRRALVALDAGDSRVAVLPGVVMRELAGLLNTLASNIPQCGGSAGTTWQPEAYHSIVSSSVVGAAVLPFFGSRDVRECAGEQTGNARKLMGLELARARRVFTDLESTHGGNEAAHPGVTLGVALSTSR